MSGYDYIDGGGGHAPIKAWTRGVPIEEAALRQLKNVAALPFVHRHLAVMPDVHWGMGATIGSVIATKGAIVPAAVGVDIGCGMAAQRTTLTASDLPDNLLGVRTAIERAVPHGRTNNGGPGDRGAWGELPAAYAEVVTPQLQALVGIVEKHPKLRQAADKAHTHAGTLGTGNHFVEVCLDEEDRVWVMLHSGSRGIGNRIGSYFIERAKGEMRRWFVNLPDADLAYLPQGSELFDDYFAAVGWAQAYARTNRELMMGAALGALSSALGREVAVDQHAVNCHHNYVQWEKHFGENLMVTRKGAVRAGEGELGIIPGSMGAKSFIVRGKGNAESFCTCSHGAGRAMSRAEAKRRFTLEDHAAATAGVECRKDAEVIDETPMAYKDIDAVMAAQADLVEVVHTLRQVVCVKGVIRVGTAGWAIPRGVADAFPPEGSGLGRYAARFGCVEINATFYRSPRRSTFERWAAAVPPGFRFATKLSGAITHERRLVGCEDLLGAALGEAEALGDRLGPLLIQLPPTLAFDATVAEPFLRAFRERTDRPAALEPRHASWFGEPADALLAAQKTARVAADPARAPGAERPGGWPGLVYVRLHGSPAVYRTPYGPDRLAPTARLLKADEAAERWCILDNTASGAAAADALTLQDMLAGIEGN